MMKIPIYVLHSSSILTTCSSTGLFWLIWYTWMGPLCTPEHSRRRNDLSTYKDNPEQMQKMMEELRVEVIEDVTRKVTEDVTTKLTKQFEVMKLLMQSEGNEGRSSHSLTQVETSAYRKESIGDGDHVASEKEPISENNAVDEEFVQVEDV